MCLQTTEDGPINSRFSKTHGERTNLLANKLNYLSRPPRDSNEDSNVRYGRLSDTTSSVVYTLILGTGLPLFTSTVHVHRHVYLLQSRFRDR